mmetsp:Transcript_6877/g.7532  ORF Transcript_6877/g.7532 Transcript_6877/m.7532 type:complete len:598 (+) Transcript_6877:108-1901(+)
MAHNASKKFKNWLKHKKNIRKEKLAPVPKSPQKRVRKKKVAVASTSSGPRRKSLIIKAKTKINYNSRKRKRDEPNSEDEDADYVDKNSSNNFYRDRPTRKRSKVTNDFIDFASDSDEDKRAFIPTDAPLPTRRAKAASKMDEYVTLQKKKVSASYESLLQDADSSFLLPEGNIRQIRAAELSVDYLIQTRFNKPVLIRDKGVVWLKIPRENWNLDVINTLVGPNEQIDVMDVKNQQEVLPKWNMQKWRDYFVNSNRDVLYNCISLEFSHTKLSGYVRAPEIVQELDWVSKYWPDDRNKLYRKPKVQYYCLMSPAGCYTDFHIDFGGSSVWYHLVKGQKIFYLIPPTEDNLLHYEEWSNSETQEHRFLPEEISGVIKVVVEAGNTLLIPSGWIHAVHTTKDSIVFGGNFLHDIGISMQIRVSRIEEKTQVPSKFRFPFFAHLVWYTTQSFFSKILNNEEISVVDRPALCDLKDWTGLHKKVNPQDLKHHPDYIVDVIEAYIKDTELPDYENYRGRKTVIEPLYCICRQPWNHLSDKDPMIGCDGCSEWYHYKCIGMTAAIAKGISSFKCKQCRSTEAKAEQPKTIKTMVKIKMKNKHF